MRPRAVALRTLVAVLAVPMMVSAQGAPYSSPLYVGCGVYSCFTLEGTITPRIDGGSTSYDLLAHATFTLLPAAFVPEFYLISRGTARFDFFNAPGNQEFFEDAGFFSTFYTVRTLTPGQPVTSDYAVRSIPFRPTFDGASVSLTFATANFVTTGAEGYALTATPEPAPLALTVAGLGAVGAFVRRRQRA